MRNKTSLESQVNDFYARHEQVLQQSEIAKQNYKVHFKNSFMHFFT